MQRRSSGDFKRKDTQEGDSSNTPLRRGSPTEQGWQLVDMMIENQRRESDEAANKLFESKFISNLKEREIHIF